MNKPVKVIEVKEAPQLQWAAIQQGIRDKAAAENWGSKYGYATVYFMARKQKVYAERLQVKVDDQPQATKVPEPAASCRPAKCLGLRRPDPAR